MLLTIILMLINCVLLFLMILAAKNFPEDIQQRLVPRLDEIDKKPAAPRIVGAVIMIMLCIGFCVSFVIGFADGRANGFTFSRHLARSLIMAFGVKAFDIIGLDYFLLTKTHFFQHFFPETEGCAGWKQFGYNRRQHLRQSVFMLIACVVISYLVSR